MPRFTLNTVFLLCCVFYCSSLLAIDMRFSGTLNAPPPCLINNGDVVDVDFGNDIGVNTVDGKNYLQPINYKITCESGLVNSNVTLTFNAIATTFDHAAVQTSLEGLGIRILIDGTPIEFDKAMVIDPTNPPVLQAVPVNDPEIVLHEGEFNASAMLSAEYQ
ncbi:fimbrial protein [Enterobacter cloacae]|uniref:fimbrial protein n=1 Tax=Enterobacter cloacae TaxID=550 RepID=UPI00334A5E4C